MHGPAAGGDFTVRNSEHRIVATDFHTRTSGRSSAAASAEAAGTLQQAFRLPRFQISELIGKRFGIAGDLERFTGEDGGGDVMAVLAGRLIRGKPGDDHIRLERADDANDIGQNLLPVPNAQRFAIILGIAKIHRAGEKLFATVQPARSQQFLRANDAEFFAEFRSEHVLAAVAARDRKISGAIVPAPREKGDELRVLVIGMRGDVKHPASLAKIFQLLKNGGGRTGLRLGGENWAGKNKNSHARHSHAKSALQLAQTSCQTGEENSPIFHFRLEIRSSFKAGEFYEFIRPVCKKCYFGTVNAAEYCVFSHIILKIPPPSGFLAMAIVS